MEYRCVGLFLTLVFLLLDGRVSHHQIFAAAKSEPKHIRQCAEFAKHVFSFIDDPTGLTDDKILNDNCIGVEALIHGGENATSMEFPFMALVGFGDGPDINWKCGGSLISENFVLSAAHCSFNKWVGYAKWVRLGDLDVSTDQDDAAPEDIAITERFVHPNYDKKTKYNDIALFKLARKVNFNAFIRPICLYSGPHIDKKSSIITGWGATERGKFSAILQKATVKLNTEKECNSIYNEKYLGLPNGLNWTSMVCARGDNYIDSCRGDSGGPLFISINDVHYCMMSQVGITSFGKECNTNSPGVYTRISAYIPWIESIVWP